MNDLHNKRLTPNAKKLRREMTREERHLWYDFLKNLTCTVHRQKIIGPCIADFYIASAGVVIELDGSQHYEPENQRTDRGRDAYFESKGLKVLRFSNSDIWQNFDGVCQEILREVSAD